MSLDLVRIDDRLIHGQVVVGWVQALGIDRIVLVDDEVSADPFERELCALGVPPGIDVEILSVDAAAAAIDEWVDAKRRTMVLVGDVSTIARLAERTPRIEHVNIGGLHEGDERAERLSYVYLSEREADLLKQLRARGIEVSAQDVPTARAVALDDLL